MITLVGNKKKASFIAIQGKLDELTVSYSMKYTRETPYLKDGKLEIKGEKEINAYLEDLETELRQWYYCSI